MTNKKVESKYEGMDTKTFLKTKYSEIKNNFENETKRKVAARKTNDFFTKLLRFILIFGFCFIILFPIFQKLTLAFRAPADLNNPQVVWIPANFSTLNFEIAASVLKFKDALANNIFVSIVCMVLQVIVCSLAGYAFSRLKFKGSNLFFWAVMITIILPPQLLSSSRYTLYNSMNIQGKIWSIFLITGLGMGIRSALFIYLFRQFFSGLPKELEESAQIDGAGVFKTFYKVMFPNARGVMLTVAVFAFVWQWNDIYYAGLLKISTETFPLLTSQLANTGENLAYILKRFGYEQIVGEDVMKNKLFVGLIANTSALICLSPLLIIYIFVQRFFVEGIERTGIVG